MISELKKLLRFERGDPIGLDIGSSAVKLVKLQKDANGSYAVIAAAYFDTPKNDDQINVHGERRTPNSIENYLKSIPDNNRFAVCGVAGQDVAVRRFSFPPLPRQEIENALRLEASQICPLQIDRATVDYQLIPDGSKNMTGLLVAATDNLIKTKVDFAGKAKLSCVLMDVEGLALLNCFAQLQKTKSHSTTAILNIGNSCTTVAVTGVNAFPFVRDIAFAGSHIVDKIASESNIPKDRVTEILNTGCDFNGIKNSFEDAVGQLSDVVSETLRYYRTVHKFAFIEKIYLCGGFALVKPLPELLRSRMEENVVLWNPFNSIAVLPSCQFLDVITEKGPALAVAAGLAMRSF